MKFHGVAEQQDDESRVSLDVDLIRKKCCKRTAARTRLHHMGRFTRKAADLGYYCWLRQMFWAMRPVGARYITDLKTRDHRARCRELSRAGGSKHVGSVRQVVRLRYEPSRGVPAALCHPRDLTRPVARRRADTTAAKPACAEIGG